MTQSASDPSIWRHRGFMAFCASGFLSNAGGHMQTGAVPYLVYEATGSYSWVGLAGFVGFFPCMVATLAGGALADRYSKAALLMVTQMLLALSVVPLCLIARSPDLNMPVLLGSLGIQSLLLGLSIPAFQTVGPQMVGATLVSRAINVNSAQAQLAKMIGPMAVGVVLASYGAVWAFSANAVTYLLAAVVAFWLVRNHNEVLQPVHRNTHRVASNFAEGARSVWNHRGRRLAVVMIASAMFLGAPLYQAISVLGHEQLQAGPETYGLLLGLYGLGATLGTVVNHRLTAKPSSVLRVVLVAYAGAIALTAVSSSVVVSALSITLAGMGYLLTSVTLMTSIQTMTPEYLRGRVVAIYSFGYVGGVPIGNLVQGWLGAHIGVGTALIIAAGLLAVLGLWFGVRKDWCRLIDGELETVIDLREGNTLPTYVREATPDTISI